MGSLQVASIVRTFGEQAVEQIFDVPVIWDITIAMSRHRYGEATWLETQLVEPQYNPYYARADSRLAFSQWETSLQSNAVIAPGCGTHSMKVTTYAPPFRTPF